ncbi:hypothetical protein D9756_010335 [Leucocoprinus leucothites]|uniref:Nephrocystin 3-like N-terminal domain-containing protein n=1 Tax=Leucocoprinus leucothites TaxID=201217 RepID=A0A8H5CUC5_9AGAR|nr:hypothetical protein D9756_010335 [Leucoagaricus leucothites]
MLSAVIRVLKVRSLDAAIRCRSQPHSVHLPLPSPIMPWFNKSLKIQDILPGRKKRKNNASPVNTGNPSLDSPVKPLQQPNSTHGDQWIANESGILSPALVLPRIDISSPGASHLSTPAPSSLGTTRHSPSRSVSSIHSANTNKSQINDISPSERPAHHLSTQGPTSGHSAHHVSNSHTSSRQPYQAGSSYLTGAHDFSVGNLVVIGHSEGTSQSWGERGREALQRLEDKAMPNAMLNSKERAYPPRCTQNTRQVLRDRIFHWGTTEGDSSNQRLFWLSGPAGIGKSAVAQTVAEDFKKKGLLGATFFFSRPNKRDDPDAVIPTLVYQLTQLIPHYKSLITEQLINTRFILDYERESMFEALITNPFRALPTQSHPECHKPLLMVLNGLDECNGFKAQREFVEMISRFSRAEGGSRFRWLICSRPEPNLKAAFLDVGPTCQQEILKVDDSDAQKDAIRILKTGFTEIRKKYPDQLPPDWPDESQIAYIAHRASGHLGFASFIIRFIGDEDYDDPSGQLDTCMRFLGGISGPEDTNPLHTLDLLYTQILSGIPTHIIRTTRLIIGFFILYGNKDLTALVLANILGLDQASFYRALRRLHSVIRVPPASEAHEKSIQIYHASFSDYLKDPTRSGKFGLNEQEVHCPEVAFWGLNWLGYWCQGRSSSPIKHLFASKQQSLSELPWPPPESHRDSVIDSLRKISFVPCWKACPLVPETSLELLIKALQNLDFNLPYSEEWYSETEVFAHFIRWMLSLTPSYEPPVVVDRWHVAGQGDLRTKGEMTIWHCDDDPYAFVASFLEDVTRADHYAIHLRLGRPNPKAVRLAITKYTDPRFL